MLMVFDVGNTNIVIGVFADKTLLTHWRIRTDQIKTADEYAMTLKSFFDFSRLRMEDIEAVVISSVVPTLMTELTTMSKRYFKYDPLIIAPGTKTGLPIKYDNPREVGADRVVNAVAAVHKSARPGHGRHPHGRARRGGPGRHPPRRRRGRVGPVRQ